MNINKLFNQAKDFINDKKAQYTNYQRSVSNSKSIILNNIIMYKKDMLNEGNIHEYNTMCPYINLEYAKIIDNIKDIDEEIINITYFRQKIDNQEFILLFTTKKIIVMNKEKYNIYKFNEITKFEQITKSLMSQIINFNDVIIEVYLNQENLNILYNLIFNTDYRASIIKQSLSYLCGITPIYQNMNQIKSGISIDSSNNIVFHDRKINNYLVNYNDIINYEVLEDNTPVIRKKMINQGYGLGFSKKECHNMKLRITLKDNTVYEITILEDTTFNASFSHTDKTYIKYFNFAKDIMTKLDSLNTKLY